MKPANSTMAGLGTTVFEVMSALAREHNSVNLGQGFPDDKGPEEVRAAAADYLLNGHNQYPPMMGIPELRQAVAEHARRFQGLDVDWQSEVLVTSGATEALADCLFGLIEPGDEVVLIEPLYDSYLPIVRRAGGIPKLVRLEPPEWRLPKEELAAAFGPKTKLILFNTVCCPLCACLKPHFSKTREPRSSRTFCSCASGKPCRTPKVSFGWRRSISASAHMLSK